MDCNDSRNRLHAYLDQELDAPSALAIDEHVASCPACKALFTEQAALQAGVRRHAAYHGAPARLADRIRASIDATAVRTPRRWFQLGAAVAATALVSWLAAVQYTSPSEDEIITGQVVAGHARSVVASHAVDVMSSDQHTVKPWLSSKLDFSPPVWDLAGAGFALMGGRLEYVDNRPVATLVYRQREHVIDLFVWPDRARRSLPMRSSSKQGYNVLHWTDAGMAFWAISDLNPAEMKTFAEAYTSAR